MDTIDTWSHAAASTHDRGHAHAQDRPRDAERLHPRRSQVRAFLGARPTPRLGLRRFQLHLVDRGTSAGDSERDITGLKFFFDTPR